MAKYSPAFYSLQLAIAAASQRRISNSYASDFFNEESSLHPHDPNSAIKSNAPIDKISQNSICSSSQEIEDQNSRKRRWSAPDNVEDDAQAHTTLN